MSEIVSDQSISGVIGIALSYSAKALARRATNNARGARIAKFFSPISRVYRADIATNDFRARKILPKRGMKIFVYIDSYLCPETC